MCEQELGVGPGSPFRAVDVVTKGLLLLVGGLGEECLGGLDDVFDVNAFVLVLEEAFSDDA